ncbi:aminotransferase class V-fold PLP-dependent enzyme [Streptomyces yatensis]|uniref:Aminotransferase class V-fold PLP-dependent enzyme n=1 Tax=Streptomyces yatensis TaxID=155177 RepID=A0ABP4TFW4_9ACTN|nr:aminotransferase class V-fold PLP-dependent enzyme [Streptomyces yatensis]
MTAAPSHWTLDPSVGHLNHGSFGAVPRTVQDAQRALREEMETNPDAWFRELPERVGRARAAVARFLRVPAEHTALVANASAGVSTVLGSLALPPDAEVLLTDHTYGAVAMGTARAAERAGARVRTLHIPLDATAEEIAAVVEGALSEVTALVVVDQITSPTARLFPVAEIARLAHAVGAKVLVDGAHAPGMLADPVGLSGAADFWVGNLHKWCCAPRGTAALVARGPDAQDLWPLTDSWGTPDPFPQRFDVQGTLDLTAWLAAPRSLEFVEETYGWDAARERISKLAEVAQGLLADALGADLTAVGGSEAPAMRLVPLPAGLATDHEAAHVLQRAIAAGTGCETAITSWDGRGFLRLSAHLYNTVSDYERLAERLPEVLRA